MVMHETSTFRLTHNELELTNGSSESKYNKTQCNQVRHTTEERGLKLLSTLGKKPQTKKDKNDNNKGKDNKTRDENHNKNDRHK